VSKRFSTMPRFLPTLLTIIWGLSLPNLIANEPPLLAAAAKVNITDYAAGPVHDPSHARAIVFEQAGQRSAIIAVDAVAVGEIGQLGNAFLLRLRQRLEAEVGIPPSRLIINASHCHSSVRTDSADLIADSVVKSCAHFTPVAVSWTTTQNPRISENRRLLLKDGSQSDMRRAYPTVESDSVAKLGPIDPTIGTLQLSRPDGTPFAVFYHFACHPIMNPPSSGNSADFAGLASARLEESLGHHAIALFLQGCGGDINPRSYKDSGSPADAAPLANELALSVLAAMKTAPAPRVQTLRIESKTIELPRGRDFAARILALENEQQRLLRSLKNTPLNFEAFVPLWLQQHLNPQTPSAHAQTSLHEESIASSLRKRHDTDQLAAARNYRANISTLEQLIRLNTNLALLKKHEARAQQSQMAPLQGQLCGIRIGDFRLITFPGELTVEVGLSIKKRFPNSPVFVSGYTNGYLYYLPTASQRVNPSFAQEDCDCDVAPEWHNTFEKNALDLLQKLTP
jgi:hypothetical protein